MEGGKNDIKSRSRDTSQEAITIIQDGDSGGYEKSFSEYIFKVKKISFGKDWMWNKREREKTRMTPNLLTCAIGQSMDSNEMGKILEGASMEEGQGSVLDM